MSTTIDQRVVEMRFDNKNFESNVSTTMSTLDRLKQSLRLDGASKGLENVSDAARKVDMSSLGSSVETVRTKFSTLEVMAVTALANITNSAVNAGKRIVSALTIQPITTGFNEYELKMDSVKTIMASTGESVETVNKYLDELNEYSDQTIYSFSDMTQNIGKFTNAGVKLEDAVMAIKGISNEAAVSGANTNEASRAMYNFAQALSAGHVKLIDWKSIELANMATKEFKEQLIASAVSCGTLTKTADGMYKTLDGTVLNATKNFNESLQDQWMTTDVLVSTLKDYANEETEIGKKAFAAAQEVTKLSQMFDVLKETAQSGWARTWELIFGNILEAKAIFTPLTNFFSGIIDKMSDFRNNLLESALASPFVALADKLKTVTTVTEKAVKTAQDYADIVDRVINLEFGLGQERWDKLTEMGYDWAHVQNLVNEKLGDSHRYETNYKESVDDANKSQATTIEQLMEMSEAQLKHLGFTDEEIKAFKELAEQSEKTGIPIQDLIKDMDQLSGRSLLINSFKNIGKGLIAVFNSLKDAWQDIFPPKSLEERSEQLYNLIAALHKFTAALVPTEEELKDSNSTFGKLTRTFKGLFAALDIVTTIVGGGFKAAITVVKTLLGYFNVDILTVTASIGDALVKFRDWIDKHNLLAKAVEWLAPYMEKFANAISKFIKYIKDSGYVEKFANWIKEAAAAVSEWFNRIKNSESVQKFVNYLKTSGEAIKNWVAGIKEADNIPKYILSGLVNGLKAGIKDVGKAAMDLGTKLLDKIKEVLGIHSPSVKFFEVGENIIQGLVNGIQNGAVTVWETIKNLGSKCVEIIKEIDFGAIIAVAISAGVVTGFLKISNAISNFSKMFEGLGDIFEGAGEMLEDFGTGVKRAMTGLGMYLNSKAILSFAIALGILAASIVVLSLLDPAKMWGAIGAIAALSAIMIALMVTMSKVGKTVDGKMSIDLAKIAVTLLAIAGSLMLMAIAMKIVGGLGNEEFTRGVIAVAAFGGIIVGLMAATKLLTTGDALGKVGIVLLEMSVAMLIMASIVKKLGELDNATLIRGTLAISAFGGIIVGLMAATKLAGGASVNGIGASMLKISIGILLMAVVVKLLGDMGTATIIKGTLAITAFGGIIVGLIAATKLAAGPKADNIGSTILKISVAIVLMAIVIKLIGGLDNATLIRGTLAIVAFGGIVVGLIAATQLAGGSKADKIGGTILKISLAIGVMALVVMMLSLLNEDTLKKGIYSISAFGAIIVGLIAATQLAGGSKADKIGGTILKISLAIAILAGVSALLGLIETKTLVKGIVAVAALGLIISGLMAATKLVGTGDGTKTIVSLIAAIVVLAAALIVLSLVDTTKLLGATVALGVVLAAFALLVKCSNNVKSSLGVLIVMTLAIGVLAGALYLIAQLPVQSSLGSAAAISVLMIAMAAILVIISKMKVGVADALVGLLGLAAMGLIMWEFIAILKQMNGMENVTTNVLAIVGLMTAMTLLLVITAAVGTLYLATYGVAATGLVGLAAMGLIMWEFIAILKQMNGMENAEANAKLITNLMTTMTALLVILAIVGPLALIGVTAMSALVGLIVAIGALAVGIGALMTEFPQLKEFLDSGIPVMEQLAYAIGSMVGNFVAGFSNAVFQTLPVLGECLTQFMNNARGFIEVVKMVDEKVIAGAGFLSLAIIALTAADLLAGVSSFIQGGSSLADLGTELSNFMTNAKPFIDGASTLNAEMMAGVKALAETILILSAANVLDGLTKLFGGGSSLSNFGAQLPQLGTDISNFAANLGTFDESKVTTITCAANAIKAISQAAEDLPNEGGWLAKIVGDNTIDKFGSYLPTLGTNLSQFANNLGEFSEEKVAAVTCAADAVRAISEAAEGIPNEGGWLGKIVGDNSISTFGAHLPILGTNLAGFATNLGEFDETKVATVTCAANAIKAISEAAEGIPNEGGWLSKIVGDNSISTFGGYLPGLGTNLAGFATNLGTFTAAQVETVSCAADAIKSMAEVAKDLPNGQAEWAKKIFGDNSLSGLSSHFGNLGTGIKNFATNLGTFTAAQVETVRQAINALKVIATLAQTDLSSAKSNIPKFGDSLVDLAKDLTSFCENMPAYETVKSAIDAAKYAFTTMNNIGGADSSVSTTLSKSLKDLAKSGLDSFIDQFTNGTAKKNVKDAGETIVKSLIDGVDNKKDKFNKTVKGLGEDAADELDDVKSDFKSAGEDLVAGFANGISLKTYVATRAAAAMAAAAAEAAKEELDINSPSKVFMAIAASIPEGFAKGIDKYGNIVEQSSTSMGDTAIKSVKDSISRIAAFINGDMDAQPTIRPVLDLSDVRSGAGLIGGLLNTDSSVGVLANVGSISTMMNNRSQNGVNGDIVSAINKLRKDIGNIRNTTYQVNGVTYDDGSNISDAVKSIVRAAKVERRR